MIENLVFLKVASAQCMQSLLKKLDSKAAHTVSIKLRAAHTTTKKQMQKSSYDGASPSFLFATTVCDTF